MRVAICTAASAKRIPQWGRETYSIRFDVCRDNATRSEQTFHKPEPGKRSLMRRASVSIVSVILAGSSDRYMALQMREGAPARQPELKLNRQLSRVTDQSDVRRRPKFGWGVVRRSGEPAGRVSGPPMRRLGSLTRRSAEVSAAWRSAIARSIAALAASNAVSCASSSDCGVGSSL